MMQLLYGKTKWEMGEDALETFLRRVKADGYDVAEIYLPTLTDSPREVRDRVADNGLQFVAQIVTNGATPDEHIESLKQRFERALEMEPLFVNSHTGRDHFDFADNLRIFEAALELARQAGILVTHETHRGRPLFAAHETRRYLEALPDLALNADFSHWFCVHESDLSDQPDNVAAAIARSRYIHARAGHEEGPQIPDPFAREWAVTLGKFTGLWQRIVDARRADGSPFLVVTPEAGPHPYMVAQPYTQVPMADAWEINRRMLHHLKARLK